jgi:hypothetical protein
VSGDDELVSYVHMESIETAEDERLTIAEEVDNQDEILSAHPQQEILLVIEESDFQSFKVSIETVFFATRMRNSRIFVLRICSLCAYRYTYKNMLVKKYRVPYVVSSSE